MFGTIAVLILSLELAVCQSLTPARENDVEAIRLVGGDNTREGRVEVMVDGFWGTICEDSTNNAIARVICHSIGSPSPDATVLRSNTFGPGRGRIFLASLACNGTENSINQCYWNELEIQPCDHSEDIGVVCGLRDITGVRLVNGTVAFEGRLEVQMSNMYWGTVCDDHFDDVDARVACRSLGLPTTNAVAIKHHQRTFGNGQGPIQLDDVACNGNETSLADCRVEYFHDCGHHEDVEIRCGLREITGVRLVNGTTASEGRLEVQMYNSSWGAVCDDHFDDVDARVVCRSLGLPTTNAVAIGRHQRTFGSGQGPIHLDEVACTGNETSLADCRVEYVQDCTHEEDVAIRCGLLEITGVRLVNGTTSWEGRLEVQMYNSSWGTVCDDNFEDVDARVVCRSLGLPTTNAVALWSNKRTFGSGQGSIYFNKVACNGNETSLADCRVEYIHDCNHEEDVAIRCGLREITGVRLVNGTTSLEGRLEVQMYNSSWGTVCDDFFENVDARVVCRSLGFPTTNAVAIRLSQRTFGSGQGPIHLDDVRCNGNETSLAECRVEYVHNCNHEEDVEIRCG